MRFWKLPLLLALSTAPSIWAQDTVSVANEPALPGSTAFVPVQIQMAANAPFNVVALQADIMFDATALAPGQPALGSALSGHVLASSMPTNGVLRVLLYSSQFQAVTNGTLTTIPFTLAPTAVGNLRLVLGNVLLSTSAAASVPTTNASGSIFVQPAQQVHLVHLRPNGVADVFFGAVSNQVYILQASTNLVDWFNIATNVALSSVLQFTDQNAPSYRYRFYRSALFDAASAVAIGNVILLDGHQLTYQMATVPGHTYIIEGSTNLANWTDLVTNVATSTTLVITNQVDAKFPYRLFRVRTTR